ncbi:hypothetical protein N2152v2_007075 [Parachlorella kessleri]
MLLHSGRDFTTSGAFNVSPLAIIGGAPCNVTLGTVPRETLEGFFTRLLNGVSDGETNTGAAAAAAAAAEAAQQGASLEQQLQRAEEPLLAALKERGALPGKSEAEKGDSSTAAAAADKERVATLEEQLRQAEQRARRAEGERHRIGGEFHRLFTDLRISVQADIEQLSGLLRSQPSLLEDRRNAIAAAPQRGILVSAGTGKHLANSFVNLHVIRHYLESSLPISIAYWSKTEPIPDKAKAFFKVLCLDSDSTPLIRPESLFETPEFEKHGNLFFPDRWKVPAGAEFTGDERMRLFNYFGLQNPWAKDKQRLWPPQTDSGQLLLDRHTHVDVLEWLLFLNSRNEFTYRAAWGDKDTFRASFDLAGKSEDFYLSPHRIAQALYKAEGGKYKVRGYTQLAPNGTVAFLHRSFITKYDPKSDEGRPSSHLSVELTDVRGRVNSRLQDLDENQVQEVPPDKCHFDPSDFTESLKKCGYDSEATSLPIPVFPIPEGSPAAKGLHAAEEAYLLLRSAMQSNPSLIPL